MLPNIEFYNQAANGAVQVRNPEPEKAIETAKAAAEKGNEAAAANAQSAKTADNREKRDQAEINFSVSREERDAFMAVFSEKQDPAAMSPEERETLRKASERITKFVEEAIARNASNRERVEKAVGEWYSRMTNGEHRGPTDLVDLLRQAAMGNLDGLGK